MPLNTLRTIATLLSLSLASTSVAQSKSEVKFAPGNFGTMVSGTITGQEYTDYQLGAKAGQEMFVELSVTNSTGSGTVYFNILPPGGDGMAIYNSSINGNSTTVDLPANGTYAIRVYHMGNDEDTGKTSSFNIDLSIQ
ncbi:hypothetical protein [Marivita sp.]|jgi:hypothetical protein|uniref:hypothetical protein n=1 Tax=Marivita sp. TaxID=2003365 RepID=UPI00321BBCCA